MFDTGLFSSVRALDEDESAQVHMGFLLRFATPLSPSLVCVHVWA
jgi:hypothetical protein